MGSIFDRLGMLLQLCIDLAHDPSKQLTLARLNRSVISSVSEFGSNNTSLAWR